MRYCGCTNKIGKPTCMHVQAMYMKCMHKSVFGNSFYTVQNLGVLKKIKVSQQGLMNTHNNFCTPLCTKKTWEPYVHACTCNACKCA